MKEHFITKNSAGQRLDKYLTKALPSLPQSLMHKYFRLKRIKVNGKRTDPSYRLLENDTVQLYINDEFFEENRLEDAYLRVSDAIDVVYEDDNILLVNKPCGMVVHEDESGKDDTLINRIKSHLYRSGEWDPCDSPFTPSLCNRIDRNTQGIVIAAKTAEALRILNERIKEREIDKYYICLVHGTPKTQKGILKNYLRRDTKEKRVFIDKDRSRGALTAETEYTVLSSKKGISMLKCKLLTGRTHQIRAQLAAAGHPLIGDTKYGTAAQNKNLPFKGQTLCSYKLIFNFKSDAGTLSYLNGKSFEIQNIDFRDWFLQNL